MLSVELSLTFYFNYIFQLKNMEDMFPVEIWMHIFEWIDLSKLMELRLVSRFFFNLIEYFLNKSPKWKELAESTIMFEFVNSTKQRAYPYYLGSNDSNINDPILWQGTYLSYKKWQKILGKEHEKDFIVPMSSCSRITCISTFDKYISIGLDDGFIENYSTDDLKTPFYIANCNIFIKQTAFWYTSYVITYHTILPITAIESRLSSLAGIPSTSKSSPNASSSLLLVSALSISLYDKLNLRNVDMNTMDPSEMARFLITVVRKALNDVAPFVVRKVSRRQSPWLTHDLKLELRHRDVIYKRARRTNDQSLLERRIKLISFSFYLDDQVLVVIIGKDNTLKFLDLQNKVEISTPGFFANCINYGECRHFCIGDMDGILTCYEKFENNIIAGQTLNLNLREFEILLIHFSDGQTISALTYYNGTTKFRYCQITLESERVSSILHFTGTLPVTVPRVLRSTLKNIVALSNDFYLGIGKNKIGSTHYCYDKWYRIVLIKYFGCCITSIMIHAQILIFGLEDGSIHMLHFDHYNDILSLKKKKFRDAIKIEVDTVPIIKLNILETDKKPCIVASTESRVHLINFF
ncbi:hypothetical protein KQX54_013390 [Cotesia glomerata]|uniref:F-box domain-containing protein n=1 Tax=Cotesia glomerata TaxID=32391 RepID=A0AAV7I5U4_COTGL|nr:hypothetical protein KQX54_013390 [Cotesia glomerata]